MSRASQRQERRRLRAATRRRRRHLGVRRTPASVQHLARRVGDSAYAARDAGARAVSGDRPLVLALIGLLALGAVMLSGPLQRYMDGHDRVELLQEKVQALQAENQTLQQRKQDLQDPDKVEQLAREQLDMIYPGEVPYAIVPPPDDRPQITDPSPQTTDSGPWYERAWHAVTDVFR